MYSRAYPSLRSLLGGVICSLSCTLIHTAAAQSLEDSSLIGTAFTHGRSAVFGGRFFFVVNDGTHGAELWQSNGTTAGTLLFQDQNGTNGSRIEQLTAVGNNLFFVANGGDLWCTDGTAVNTRLIKGGIHAWDLTAAAGKLYFSAIQHNTGREPWVSDGTPSGTFQLADIYPGNSPSEPTRFTAAAGTVFFRANTAVSNGSGRKAKTTLIGNELWKTNGTPAGTVLVKDIYPGFNGSSPDQLVASNNTLFFTASSPNFGTELWRSDGSAGGTTLVKDIEPGFRSSNIFGLRVFKEKLLFQASSNFALGLWQSDGTPAGTAPANNIAPGVPGFPSVEIFRFGNRDVVVTATANGVELWSTDGTAAGARFLSSLVPNGDAFAEVRLDFEPAANQLFFVAFRPDTGTELHATDGTPEGTRLVRDIYPTTTPFAPPVFLASVGSKLFFIADQATSGEELWVTDGTSAGTFIPRDFQID